jgi:hypothetical protein
VARGRKSRRAEKKADMVLVEEDEVKVETELYGELKRDLGKNFQLFAETVNLKEWKRKGPYVPPEADMGSKRNAQAFPPLLSRWSLRQTKEVVVPSTKPIRLNPQTRQQLDEVLGAKRTQVLIDNIGFDARPPRDGDVKEKEVKVLETAWGKNAEWPNYELNGTWAIRKPHPTFKDTVVVTDLANVGLGPRMDDDRRNLVGIGATMSQTARFRPKEGPQAPSSLKVNGKFYWPHMTNPVAKIPCTISKNTRVKDLTDWLKFYGEPHPDKIPTGTMTTFEPLARIVAGGKSKAKTSVCKVDGRTWKKEFDVMRGLDT